MRLRLVLASALLAAGPALAQDLNLISAVDVKDEGASVVLSVKGSRPPNFTTFSMADPPRFVIDLSESRFQGVPADLPFDDPLILVVKNLSYGSDATSIARILIAFAVDVDPPDVQTQGTSLVVRIAKPPGVAGVPVARAGTDRREQADAQARAEAERRAQEEAQARAEAQRLADEEAKARAAAQAEADRRARAEQEAQAAAAQLAATAQAAQLAGAAALDAELQAGDAARKEEALRAKEESDRLEAAAAASAAAAQDARKRKEEEAARKLEARRQREEAIAAARAEALRKKQEETERKAEARRQRQEAIAAARAEGLRKKQEETERKAEARRQRQEAIAAARAEALRKKQEEAERRAEERRARAAARLAEAEPQREAVQVATGPSAQLREVGFRQMAGVSRVFVRTSVPPRFTIQDAGENLIRVELENTRVLRPNDARFLDTSFFPSAVAMVTPSRRGSSYVVEIKLREMVPYQQKIEGDMLAIDFERPASASAEVPAPAAAAR